MERFDVAVIGAGAAGLYCAGIAGQRGLRVVLLDHAGRLAEKIRISGGGRCNFTNLNGADPARYQSGDPRFARTSLRAHPPARFIERVRAHRIGFHEKHLGQLFCDDASQRIIDLLRAECAAGSVQIRHPVRLAGIERTAGDGPAGFELQTDRGRLAVRHLVVASGGLSIPAIGASDFAWRLAERWGIATVAARPGLVPLTFTAQRWQPFADLAGVALPVGIAIDAPPAGASLGRPAFHDDLLFTHRGLSGPAILQISSYWLPGERLEIDLLPDPARVGGDAEADRGPHDPAERLIDVKSGRIAALDGPARAGDGRRRQLSTVLAGVLPKRLAQAWIGAARPDRLPGLAALGGLTGDERLAEVADARLRLLVRALRHWPVAPAGTEGYRKAEVTVGGVATSELDPASMQSRRVPGSYWIGEAVDVTGWLGGYNFQWAWSSAAAAAQAIPLPARLRIGTGRPG